MVNEKLKTDESASGRTSVCYVEDNKVDCGMVDGRLEVYNRVGEQEVAEEDLGNSVPQSFRKRIDEWILGIFSRPQLAFYMDTSSICGWSDVLGQAWRTVLDQ